MRPRAGCQTPTSIRARLDLPDPLGPMMPSPLPALSTKLMLAATSRCVPGGATLAESTVSVWLGAGSDIGAACDREQSEQLVERVPALPGRDETLPVGDRKVDRRERARAQNRAGDDDAGGRLLVDDEPGADREHGRLQYHPQHF